MDLVFCAEGRFVRRSDNSVYSLNGNLTNHLWSRYLNAFDRIYVMARVLFDDSIEVRDTYLASSERVSFIDLPYYIGPSQYMKVRLDLIRVIRKYIEPGRVYICRIPGQIGNLVIGELQRKGIPYGVEVVADPWDIFAPGGLKHSFRFFFRYYSYYCLRKAVKKSVAALYVTENTLQSRYPVRSGSFQVAASDVLINIDQLPPKAKAFCQRDIYNLVSVGSLEQMYKAPDIVLYAIKKLKDRGVECYLTWLGDGIYKAPMTELTDSLGIKSQVCFRGNVPSDEVIKQLSQSDIFLLVSRTEGLPRALVEAMAMGLPCIGTQVGGIPELLDEKVLIPRDDVDALVNKVEYMIYTTNFASEQAYRNYEKSKGYYDTVLKAKRDSFYQYLISVVK